jgi:hypothetical protein
LYGATCSATNCVTYPEVINPLVTANAFGTAPASSW